MTFSAGEVTTRLVDGEVIFRAGKMDGRDQPEKTVIRLSEGRFTGEGLALFNLDKTTSLGITLLN
jgi:hypothetical protein